MIESPAMQPYANLALAIIQHRDVSPATAGIASLALEKRDVWRIASALKCAFADIDTINVEADRQTLSPVRPTATDSRPEAPSSSVLLVSEGLLGKEDMQQSMFHAIKVATKVS